jgi:hypothetical protein
MGRKTSDSDEVLPLKLKLAMSRLSTELASECNSTTGSTGTSRSTTFPPSKNPRLMIRSTLLWVIFGVVGWYYPRYLIAHEQTIIHKAAPYQVTTSGDVILDFALNEKLVDPPTIPGKLVGLMFPNECVFSFEISKLFCCLTR